MKSVILFLTATAFVAGQPAHPVPFASTQNILYLTIVNDAACTAEGLVLRVAQAPEWIRFDRADRAVPAISAHETAELQLPFVIDRMAPVQTEGTVLLSVESAGRERWEQRLRITVLAPETYELFQNYPNPFNPVTTIAYQLPEEARIRLRICDLIGRDIGTIDEGTRTPGYHRVRFDAAGHASGVYVCLLETIDPAGRHRTFRRTMVLVR